MTGTQQKDRSTRLNRVSRDRSSPNIRPKDAATLVIVDNRKGTNHVLMGRRHKDLNFLPGKYVFPGGRVAPQDRYIQTLDELPDLETRKLLVDMKGRRSPTRARALALAAIRETYEETGLLVGGRCPGTHRRTGSQTWASFFAEGIVPSLASLTFFARAITPPKRPRRYDTRFFCVSGKAVAHKTDFNDGELENLHWIALDRAMRLDVPMITRVVLEELDERLSRAGKINEFQSVPYYFMKNGNFTRELIEVRSNT